MSSRGHQCPYQGHGAQRGVSLTAAHSTGLPTAPPDSAGAVTFGPSQQGTSFVECRLKIAFIQNLGTCQCLSLWNPCHSSVGISHTPGRMAAAGAPQAHPLGQVGRLGRHAAPRTACETPRHRPPPVVGVSSSWQGICWAATGTGSDTLGRGQGPPPRGRLAGGVQGARASSE